MNLTPLCEDWTVLERTFFLVGIFGFEVIVENALALMEIRDGFGVLSVQVSIVHVFGISMKSLRLSVNLFFRDTEFLDDNFGMCVGKECACAFNDLFFLYWIIGDCFSSSSGGSLIFTLPWTGSLAASVFIGLACSLIFTLLWTGSAAALVYSSEADLPRA